MKRYIITYQLRDSNGSLVAYPFTTVTTCDPLFWYDNRKWTAEHNPSYWDMECVILMIYEVKP